MQRRVFLKSGALALVTLGLNPSFLRRTAFGAELTRGRRGKVLVCLFQRGAADALNVVVPHGEEAYYAMRPSIAIARPRAGGSASAIDLDGFFGLHPALAPLAPLWERGLLAPVHAVGSPSATRSHFDAQDYMETGTPDVKGTRDGWLNRYLALRGTCEAGCVADHGAASPPAARRVKSSRALIATVGAGPSRMRGVCADMATARKGDPPALSDRTGDSPASPAPCTAEGPRAHSSHVPFVARYRFSHPSRVDFTSGVPVSM